MTTTAWLIPLLTPPRGVGERLPNVFLRDVGIQVKHAPHVVPARQEPNDGAERDTGALDARSASHHGWIQDDTVERLHLPDYGVLLSAVRVVEGCLRSDHND
jgi:hypothetical protein